MIYIVGIISLMLGALIGRFFGNSVLNSRAKELLEKAKFSLEDAQKKAEGIGAEIERRKQIEWQAKDEEIESLREQLAFDKTSLDLKKESFVTREKEIGESLGIVKDAREVVDLLRTDIERYHANARTAFETARQKAQLVVSQSKNNADQSRELSEIRSKLEIQRNDLETLKQQHINKLESITGVSKEEAKKELKIGLLQEVKLEAATSIKKIKDEAQLEAKKEARKVVLNTIQRVAVNETIENTVVSVQLESDDLKGRIIGKDGRNIRSFEGMTGIEVIVDDTPGAVLLSGFDPVRREIAKLSMVKLLADGRIHPARIEEIVGQVKEEVEDQIGEIGQSVVIDLGLHGVDPELVKIIGRMKFRTSYSQNLLAHSIEVAKLASVMAAELGLNARMARRAGLLHDIGKVALGDHDSPHALVGRDLCKRYNEHPHVANAVGAHHSEIEMTNPISPIVQTADAISGARPGARRESLDNYVKRLEELEGIAEGFPGVQNAYAIQAGRELRVIVSSKEIDDAKAELLGDDIAKKIEEQVQYPGQIKITVIRELRSVSFAK